MSGVKRIRLGAFLSEFTDIAEALLWPLLVLVGLVALNVLGLWLARGGGLRAAAVEILAWLFGSGSVPHDPPVLDLVLLCVAGFLGYVLLGVVVWAATQALTSAYANGGVQMKTPRRGLGVVVLLAVALAGVVSWRALRDDRGAQPVSQTSPELKAVELPISYSAVTHLAQSRDLIARQGVDYRVLSVQAGPDVINALRVKGTGAVDVGSIATTPVAVMIGAGDQPVVLATLITSPAQVRLLTFSDSGISADPASLRGKRVGFVGSTVGEIYLSRLLSKAGMTEPDIKAVNGRPADLKALLLRKDLDAAVLWDPFIAQAVRQAAAMNSGREAKIFVEPGLYNLAFYLVVMRGTVDTRRPDLLRFLKACVIAGDAIESDRAAAQKELEAWLGLEQGDLKYFLDTTSFRVHLDPHQITSDLRAELEWLRARQPTTQIPQDLSPYVDSSLLTSVEAGRVVGH